MSQRKTSEEWLQIAQDNERVGGVDGGNGGGISRFFGWWRRTSRVEAIEDAIDAYQKAANGFHSEKKWTAAGEALNRAAELHLIVAEMESTMTTYTAAQLYGRAAHYFYQGIISVNSGKDAGNASDEGNDGNVCNDELDFTPFVETMRNSIRLYKENGSFRAAAQAHCHVGKFWQEHYSEQLGGALKEYQSAADLLQTETNGQTLYRNCLLQVAEIYGLLQNYGRAVETYQQLMDLVVDLPNGHWAATEVWLRIGLCHLVNGDIVAAERWIEKWPEHLVGPLLSSREGKMMIDLIGAISHNDGDALSQICTRFDAQKTLKPWVTTILLRIKKTLQRDNDSNDEADAEDLC